MNLIMKRNPILHKSRKNILFEFYLPHYNLPFRPNKKHSVVIYQRKTGNELPSK